MSVQVTREQLMKKKEQLLKSLDEVTKSLNRFDEIVYKGKFEKRFQIYDKAKRRYACKRKTSGNSVLDIV